MFTLVIGGSASGKSDYAERHVLSLDGCGPRIYIATMEPFGGEAQARIARHHAMRRDRGFETVECYRNLREICLPRNSNVLLEDLGNLAANELFGGEEAQSAAAGEDLCALLSDRIVSDIDSLLLKCGHLTIVTNEVFSGGKEYEGETLLYLRLLAALNRKLAARADLVLELACGLPEVLKAPGDTDNADMGDKAMIFVTGPLYAGKQEYIMKALGWDEADFEVFAVRDVQDLAAALAEGKDVAAMFPREKGGESAAALAEGKDAAAVSGREKDGESAAALAEGKDAAALAGKKDLEEQLKTLADALAEKRVVIATEVGGGVVPIDPVERKNREAAGRLACLLAERADIVVRVCCGLPRLLKGQPLPQEE